MRPKPELIQFVDNFSNSQHLKNGEYVGIHLRLYEKMCQARVRKYTTDNKWNIRHVKLDMPKARSIVPNDICYMSDDYITACLKHAHLKYNKTDETNTNKKIKFFLSHDSQLPERVNAIVSKYNAVVSSSTTKKNHDKNSFIMIFMIFMLFHDTWTTGPRHRFL